MACHCKCIFSATRFLQIAADELNRQFDYFGDRDRTIDFQLLTSDSGDAALFIADETAVQDPDDPLLQHISGTERVVDALPPEYAEAPMPDGLPPWPPWLPGKEKPPWADCPPGKEPPGKEPPGKPEGL